MVLLVLLDEPKTDVKYGGVIAAPVFANIMRDSLRYLEVPPTIGSVPGGADAAAQVAVPDVVGMGRSEVEAILNTAGLRFRYEGMGEVAMAQTPAAGAKVARGTTVIVYFGTEGMYNLDSTTAVVPNLVGKSLKEAALLLGAKGLAVNPVGTGFVARQDPAPGTEVPLGAAVTLYLEE